MDPALSTPFQEVLDRIEALSPEDQQAVIEVIHEITAVLRTCMFATGSADFSALRQAKLAPIK